MLQSALHGIVQRYPENTALADDQHSLSYIGLWESSLRVAASLKAQGVTTGDRVCLLSENSIDAVVLFWAVLHCNAITVYLNEQTPSEGLLHIIEDSAPSLIVATEKLAKAKFPDQMGREQHARAEFTDQIGREQHAKVEFSDQMTREEHTRADSPDQMGRDEHARVEFSDEMARKEHARIVDLATLISESKSLGISLDSRSDAVSNDPERVATIVYTSGSTGKPKGVSLTHTNLISVAKMAGDGYHTTSTDNYLMVVPLHYIHGLMILMTMHLRGAGIYFMNGFMFPKLVTRKLQETGVTGFSGVPFHFTALIERGGFLDAHLPNLRWIGITGGTCAKERLSQIRNGQPDIEIHISYGQTECSPRITALNPGKIDTKADSVGQVAEGLLVEFLGDDGQPVNDGELGELVVSGPTVMHGYWGDEKNTDRVIDEQGRLHTGDLAYIDEDGDVFIKGRLQAMIKAAGERIFPEELEAILNDCSLVTDVAVVGVPDALYGQRVEAHVILNPDTDEAMQTVKGYCLTQVAFSRSPKNYHRWVEFPLKANGKTDKQQLIELVKNSNDHPFKSQ